MEAANLSQFKVIEDFNRSKGMRAALREAEKLNLHVWYNNGTFNLDCYINGVVVLSFPAN